MKDIQLLVIDPQNDFCSPKGSLYVKGAEQDMIRLAEFIRKNMKILSDITITYDSHFIYDIAHPVFFTDSNGNHPDPMTVISLSDITQGKWHTTNPAEDKWVRTYLENLAKNGRYEHRIWPEHCLIGSEGHSCFPEVLKAVNEWERTLIAKYNAVTKGSNYRVEHFSAVRAEVEDPDDQEGTGLNIQFTEVIRDCDILLLAGEALDFCVANTLNDIIDVFGEDFARKVIILEDCTSPVLDLNILAKPFLDKMKSLGVRIMKSVDFDPTSV